MPHPLHVVVGVGPLGTSVAQALRAQGASVRMVSRSGRSPLDDVPSVAADVTTPEGARAAVAGATVVYQCAQPTYSRWAQEFPSIQSGILDAAADAGADLVIADNLYSYGNPQGAVITEDTPELATTKKGTVRRAMARVALAAHAAGRLRVATTRPANYFGPGYDQSGTTIFQKAATGSTMQLLGKPNQPHSFSYVPDAGAAMAAIGLSEHGWGRSWITAVQPPITQREFAERIWRAAGQSGAPKTSYVSRVVLRLAGLFSPTIREVVEMAYEYEQPFVASAAAFEKAFGIQPTPLDEAIAATLRAYAPRD